MARAAARGFAARAAFQIGAGTNSHRVVIGNADGRAGRAPGAAGAFIAAPPTPPVAPTPAPNVPPPGLVAVRVALASPPGPGVLPLPEEEPPMPPMADWESERMPVVVPETRSVR